ncbi:MULTISPECIES: GNAT family N-acetyltransferase [Chryseobacterium]|uniref:GNAT family acetyltransferase n=1 Tax=Chryseobacterium camelliae TaxID=1265445 RepID=A0ABU0TJT5_9FLAO|nr:MULTISPECIES: GNAT family N-acetyltransferase [Chryseobacterium]MDT3408837.1 putative GNAT family acetyltransferase [Pseudacidovorax intermedius]MDQ1097305.1 putative GNAT family acetyltransferase [Chryseobacterium camelliae]MDQ1101238.1 putative GNAT family acetyltransferase [Chryseobacterium sp. SORGH_AS_1048]MDR6084684.1 putative GNAT family acetyltransferase [Chryseobacterium sp. SORGH_AS_0909]MDR6132956.1 putative GNAT family acetyltransferase [Chryseobacterium sp. SORGH_AS_1175]
MIEIQHNNDEKRGSFAAYVDGEQAGLMTYTWAGDTRFIIDHTEVEKAYNGKGVGKEMLYAAVSYARENGKKIIPLCPFAKANFQKHEELQDVMASQA